MSRLQLSTDLTLPLAFLEHRKVVLGGSGTGKTAGGRVVFNDEQLEFHPHSVETKIIHDFNKRLKLLGFMELATEKDSGLLR